MAGGGRYNAITIGESTLNVVQRFPETTKSGNLVFMAMKTKRLKSLNFQFSQVASSRLVIAPKDYVGHSCETRRLYRIGHHLTSDTDFGCI
jgi:hypothetical protein